MEKTLVIEFRKTDRKCTKSGEALWAYRFYLNAGGRNYYPPKDNNLLSYLLKNLKNLFAGSKETSIELKYKLRGRMLGHPQTDNPSLKELFRDEKCIDEVCYCFAFFRDCALVSADASADASAAPSRVHSIAGVMQRLNVQSAGSKNYMATNS